VREVDTKVQALLDEVSHLWGTVDELRREVLEMEQHFRTVRKLALSADARGADAVHLAKEIRPELDPVEQEEIEYGEEPLPCQTCHRRTIEGCAACGFLETRERLMAHDREDAHDPERLFSQTHNMSDLAIY
jgi:hypothetical protein